MTGPKAHQHFYDVKTYHTGIQDGRVPSIRLAYNEGAFGPSPQALAAYQAAMATLGHYPDMNCTALRQALGQAAGVSPDQIVIGNGSDELISLLTRLYVGAGDEVVHTQYGFSIYPMAAKLVGATPIAVPENNFTYTPEDILKYVTPKTKLVFLANPNNPTGFWLNRAAVHRLVQGLPPHVLLVYDAAYNDFVTEPDHENGFDLVAKHPNVVVLRTFSKIHALAALRVGWAYGTPEVIDMLNRIRNPFNLNGPALAAAVASVRDEPFIASVKQHVVLWREKLFNELKARNSLTVYPSQGNFLLVGMGSAEHALSFLAHLRANDIQIRPMAGYGLPDHVRISIGREHEMLAVLQALNSWMHAV